MCKLPNRPIFLLLLLTLVPRHSSIFLTDEEMNGEGEEDEMPELPEVMESYQDEEIIGEKEKEKVEKDEL
jgi:hypothetical protein